ncbi:hypothetical protein Q31b_28330 [Novipirellula aureliae]|uniref:Uncharacterized protein n=1 Tax=Novipirellula aureliae TaxID=2527966 RepID=A0A5C6E2L1_9BACT|nr:hypothetical protein [Novipirellula aureliae]TWU41389.1 hypothetical protein Q31b_28330 [Novipirellula aureliae]
MRQKACRYLGLLFWATASVSVVYALSRNVKDRHNSIANQYSSPSLVSYLTGSSEHLRVIDTSNRLQEHDPVFIPLGSGDWKQVGYVDRVFPSEHSATSVLITWYDPQFDPSQVEFEYHYSRGSIEEVLRMMLPPEKRRRIQERLAAAFDEHGKEFLHAFVPLVQKSIEQSMPIMELELQASLERHRSEFDGLAERWQQEVIRKKLVPLAKSEILPIVRRNGQPTAEAIGRDVWERASLWRFGWRAVYDKAPLTSRNMVQEEWRRFVEQEAVPVFESHIDEIVESIQDTLVEIATNEQVRSELKRVAEQIASDADAKALAKEILKDTLVDNKHLHRVWQDVWQSDEAQQAIDRAGQKMEPVIRQIGDELFGTRETGIDPMFALVLRNQVFGKDRRWLVARPTDQPVDDAGRRVRIAAEPMVYPVIHMAKNLP